jgi:hypothetical protein
MTDAELRAARGALRRGEDVPPVVMAELRHAVASALATGRLPSSFSPTGQWDGDVADDLLQSWLVEKLLGRNQLLALLDKARTPGAFFSMAKRNFYHWLLDSRPRSEASNIYRRLVNGLRDATDRFSLVVEAAERQNHQWALVRQPGAEPFAGTDRELAAAAFAAGDLPIVRWTSERLSPVVHTETVLDFAETLMEVLSAALTPIQIMRALGTRVDLDQIDAVALEAMAEAGQEPGEADPQPVEAEHLDAVAEVFVNALTRRQAEALLSMQDDGESGEALAERWGCSASTITNEKRRVMNFIERFVESDEERTMMLKKAVDLLYEATDD